MNTHLNLNTLLQLLENYKIIIPRIQRDYAQGRSDEHSTIVRLNLLRDIKVSYESNDQPLDLGFVYGKTEDGKFYPVDGQQRLTTLFLIHVYAFYNDSTKTDILLRFSYEARTTTRDFFEVLVKNRFDVFSSVDKPSQFIKDQAWFIDSWQYDPSVESALNMLDDIILQGFDISILKQQLEEHNEPKVVFQFLNLDDLGMEDDLYIKLNARGRALTSFENFKSKYINECQTKCPKISDETKVALDGKWADLFWNLNGKDFDKTKDFDRLYLLFFEMVFSNYNLLKAEPNKAISQYWIYNIQYQSITPKAFNVVRNTLNYLANHDTSYAYRIFSDALFSSSLYTNKIMIHAICEFVGENEAFIIENQFDDWLRVFENLVRSSRIEEADEYRKAIESIDEISQHKNNILDYLASATFKGLSGFNTEQFEEEILKAKIILKGSEHRKNILDAEQKLEYFGGQIRCALRCAEYYETDDHNKFQNFVNKIAKLFSANAPYESILLRRAMCALGDYTIAVGDYKTLCTDDPNESSRTPGLKRLFSGGSEVIRKLLDEINVADELPAQLEAIIKSYGTNIPQSDWRYCFINYPKLFDYMSKAHYRLYKSNSDMLMIPNKSSTGKNISVYLILLRDILEEKGMHLEYVTDEGRNADSFLQNDRIKVSYANGIYSVEVKNSLWNSSSNNFIEETMRYIMDNDLFTKVNSTLTDSYEHAIECLHYKGWDSERQGSDSPNILFVANEDNLIEADSLINSWATENNVNIVEITECNGALSKLQEMATEGYLTQSYISVSEEKFNLLNRPNTVLYFKRIDLMQDDLFRRIMLKFMNNQTVTLGDGRVYFAKNILFSVLTIADNMDKFKRREFIQDSKDGFVITELV